MRKFLLVVGIVFVASNLTGTLIAKFALAPMLDTGFGSTLRPPDGLQFPSLLGGYLIMSALMVLAYRYFRFASHWKINGLIFGSLCGGLTFLSDHMITAGWSVMPPMPMLISGVLDIGASIVAGLLIAYFYRNETTAIHGASN